MKETYGKNVIIIIKYKVDLFKNFLRYVVKEHVRASHGRRCLSPLNRAHKKYIFSTIKPLFVPA